MSAKDRRLRLGRRVAEWLESFPEHARVEITTHLVALGLSQRALLRKQSLLRAMQEDNDALRKADAEMRAARGEDSVVTRFLRDLARQRGTTKPRRPQVDAWLDRQLTRTPDAKAPELWERAPTSITDEITTLGAFSKRVTKARKKLRLK